MHITRRIEKQWIPPRLSSRVKETNEPKPAWTVSCDATTQTRLNRQTARFNNALRYFVLNRQNSTKYEKALDDLTYQAEKLARLNATRKRFRADNGFEIAVLSMLNCKDDDGIEFRKQARNTLTYALKMLALATGYIETPGKQLEE